MVAVPTGVVQQFETMTDKPARLLVIIAGQTEDIATDISLLLKKASACARLGDMVSIGFEIGWSFEAGINMTHGVHLSQPDMKAGAFLAPADIQLNCALKI